MTYISAASDGGFSTRIAELDLKYFEIDSDIVGSRFAVSVSQPARTTDGAPLPVVYALDSQWHGAGYEKTHSALTKVESTRPVQPYVQVSIGYPLGDDVDPIALRNRDLVPQGEPHPEGFAEYIRHHIGGDGEPVSDEKFAEFFAQLSNARADRFLAFIEQELHPVIVRDFGVTGEDAGIFGFSYGGLFALYALTQSSLFTRFGAGSPGILVPESKIFDLYREFAARSADAEREVKAHISVAEREIFGPVQTYRRLGIQTARFYDLLCEEPVPGLRVTTDLIVGEDHESGAIDAYRSFIRACYGADGRPA